jgi:hypothetical protein
VTEVQFEIAVGEKFKYSDKDVPGGNIVIKDNYGNEHIFDVKKLQLDVVDSFFSGEYVDYKLRFKEGNKVIFGWYKQEELLAGLNSGLLIGVSNASK